MTTNPKKEDRFWGVLIVSVCVILSIYTIIIAYRFSSARRDIPPEEFTPTAQTMGAEALEGEQNPIIPGVINRPIE